MRLALVRLAQDRVKLRIKTANLLEEDSTLDDDQFSYKVYEIKQEHIVLLFSSPLTFERL